MGTVANPQLIPETESSGAEVEGNLPEKQFGDVHLRVPCPHVSNPLLGVCPEAVISGDCGDGSAGVRIGVWMPRKIM